MGNHYYLWSGNGNLSPSECGFHFHFHHFHVGSDWIINIYLSLSSDKYVQFVFLLILNYESSLIILITIFITLDIFHYILLLLLLYIYSIYFVCICVCLFSFFPFTLNMSRWAFVLVLLKLTDWIHIFHVCMWFFSILMFFNLSSSIWTRYTSDLNLVAFKLVSNRFIKYMFSITVYYLLFCFHFLCCGDVVVVFFVGIMINKYCHWRAQFSYVHLNTIMNAYDFIWNAQCLYMLRVPNVLLHIVLFVRINKWFHLIFLRLFGWFFSTDFRSYCWFCFVLLGCCCHHNLISLFHLNIFFFFISYLYITNIYMLLDPKEVFFYLYYIKWSRCMGGIAFMRHLE